MNDLKIHSNNKIKVGINGLGRIGKCLVRAIYSHNSDWSKIIEIICINSNQLNAEDAVYMLKYDTVHRTAQNTISILANNYIQIDNHKPILITQIREPKDIDWGSLDVDIVFECSGKFNKKHDAMQHFNFNSLANQRKPNTVIISAPCDDADATIIRGVNDHYIAKLPNKAVISVGSCTTNCLLPLLTALEKDFIILSGFMTTIHSYTNDQSIVDKRHADRRRGRAAAMSMIPTSTGINKTLKHVMPHLSNKIHGSSIRVPTPNVSVVDFSFYHIIKDSTNIQKFNNIQINKSKLDDNLNKKTHIEQNNIKTIDIVENLQNYINDFHKNCTLDTKSQTDNLKQNLTIKNIHNISINSVISLNFDDLVSSDFIGNKYSCIVDTKEICSNKIQDNSSNLQDQYFSRILAWYDNEIAFVERMIEVAVMNYFK